jgi:hypothetical protein
VRGGLREATYIQVRCRPHHKLASAGRPDRSRLLVGHSRSSPCGTHCAAVERHLQCGHHGWTPVGPLRGAPASVCASLSWTQTQPPTPPPATVPSHVWPPTPPVCPVGCCGSGRSQDHRQLPQQQRHPTMSHPLRAGLPGLYVTTRSGQHRPDAAACSGTQCGCDLAFQLKCMSMGL